MGKETKIGLAVIGVLLAVFGGLLFRYLGAGRSLHPIEHDDPAAAAQSLTEKMIAVPKVVVAAGEEMEAKVSQAGWDEPVKAAAKTVTALADEVADHVADAAGRVADDPYAAPLESATASEPGAAVASNPFQRQRVAVNDPAHAGGRGNPLRRTNAELPLDDQQSQDPAANEAPAYEPVEMAPAAGERYETTDPAAHRDPFADTQPASQPQFEPTEPAAAPAFGQNPAEQPAVEQHFESDAAPHAADSLAMPPEPAASPAFGTSTSEAFESQPAAESPRAAVRDPFAPSVPRAREPAASANGWESEPAHQPVAAAPREVEPPVIENGQYVVQPGDTLWSISEKVYGTGGYFKAIAAHNRDDLPRSDELTVGSPIAVPPAEELERDYPSLCPKQRKSALVQPGAAPAAAPAPRSGKDVYIVAEGDTLFDIARYELGKASRWAEIYELNRATLGEDFDFLRPGTELVMPARERGSEVSRASATRYE